jgi:hypothetical protein
MAVAMKARCSLLVLFLVAVSFAPALAQNFQGVFTQQYNIFRTGHNLDETVLTPQNVNPTTFGKLFSYTVDGQIYTQPLYVPNVSIPGQGVHNVIYVATELDSVFAFDADGLSSGPLWQDSFIDLSQGIIPVPCGELCAVYPYFGITSTPVIDPTSNTMYVVSRAESSTGTGLQFLHALDITTGAEKFGGPVPLEGSVPGTGLGSKHGMISYNPLRNAQRVALLLLNGNIYIGAAGIGHGWILAYNAQTLVQTAIFNPSPNSLRSGIWQSGNGLVGDHLGHVYVETANGPFDADSGGIDYGDSVLKMDATLHVLDYFTPHDQACRWANDYDLGSAGPVLLPAQMGKHPNEIVASGKGGPPCNPVGSLVFVVDQDKMGRYGPGPIQTIVGATHGYWSSPAYWEAAAGPAIYSAGHEDYLKMYSLTKGVLSETPVSQSSNIFPIGATPSVSANGQNAGIVWAVERQESLNTKPGQLPAVLYAYDATNVSNMLYNSAQNVQRDQGGCGNKFQIPTVANGKVYVGTQNELDVFGLVSSGSAPGVDLSNPCYTFPGQVVGTTSNPLYLTLTNSGSASLSISSINIAGMNAPDFSQTNNCPSMLTAGANCTMTVTFTPSAKGPRIAQVLITDNAAGSPHNSYLTGSGEVTLPIAEKPQQGAAIPTQGREMN